MEDGIAAAHRGRLGAKGLPGHSNAGLESTFVHLDSNAAVRTNADRAGAEGCVAGDEELATAEVEVGLAISCFRDRRHKSPCQSQVHGQVRAYAPVILHEGANQFPAPPCSGSEESLIMNSTAQLPQQ